MSNTMIFDSLAHHSHYRASHPGFARAFDYLLDFSNAVPDGKYLLDGENVFALVQSYVTSEPKTKKFESHQRYIDLQYVASGEEIIYYSSLEDLIVTDSYDADKDCTLYTGDHSQPLIMCPNNFTILFPHDGHKPGCCFRREVPMKKVVLKIAV